MKLDLIRYDFTDKRTIGKLSINGVYFCFTLEDPVRAIKIPKITAIGEGTYRIVRDMSTRFKRMMIHILDVPDFLGVRIHSGDTAEDTEGCPLVGFSRGVDEIHASRIASDQLDAKVAAALEAGEEVTITVSSIPREVAT